MMPRSTIVCPTDFSELSSKALRFASELAAETGQDVLIVHVDQPAERAAAVASGMGIYPAEPPVPELLEVDKEALKEQLHRVKPTDQRAACSHRLLEGDPADAIVSVAQEVSASQIVMGSHGRQGLSRLLMGSVAEAVLREAPCPVTIVRANGA